MNGKYFSVGVGPGDPKLLTLKAVEVINMCDIIAVPKSGAKENIALKIVENYIFDNKIIELDMPMTRDEKVLKDCHNKAVFAIKERLLSGKNVAFLTLGDPSIYSTAMYLHQILAKENFYTEIISGIPSFCAAAASLGITLCERGEPLHILPASYEFEEDILEKKGTKVLMKSGKSIIKIIDNIKKSKKDIEVMMVERATMDGQKIYKSIEEMENVDENASYFSIVIIKDGRST